MDITKFVVGQKVEMTQGIYSNKGKVVEIASSSVVVSVGETTIPKDTEFIGRRHHLVSFDKAGKETADSRFDRLGLGPKQSGPGPEFGSWELA